ncbi:hypothetical protein ACKW6Q_17815 [Chryseobacterium kwangjuense]|uniref:Histidine kinase n=1 Tax=Chryseobacterium kwangjuense TaxID=267125 RepID=A0ABW9K815_9FLAO
MSTELQKAKHLVDNEQYELAISSLENLNELPWKEERYRLLFLAYSLYMVKRYNVAIDTADKLLLMNRNNEYASQIKYLSYFELENHESALNEIISFLSYNEANLYKVTLEELLVDIKNGNISEENTVYKIQELALRNNVSL